MKKILSIVLVFVMLCSTFAGLQITSHALASSGSCGDNVTYKYTNNNGIGVLTISGTGNMKNYWNMVGTSEMALSTQSPFYNEAGINYIIIKSGVTSVGNGVFKGCSGLTSITIPDSVTSIGKDAFSGCSGLTKVNISSIESWCSITFNNADYNPLCHAHNLYLNGSLLEELVIPDSITSIGDYAFYNCDGLKSVTIPNSVTSIGNYAFSGCDGLTSITIPGSVSSIGDCAFQSCSSLKSITIPNSITTINNSVFRYCSNIEAVYLYSKDIDSTQNLVSSIPANSTLYAFPSTDAELYCSIYGVNFIPLEEPRCDEGIHSYIETVTKAPTCEEAGLKTLTCRFCDNTSTETIPALGHKPNESVRENEKPATCIQAGSYDEVVYCSVCEAEISRETKTIPATGSHTPAEAVRENEVPATCTHTGGYEEVIYCSVCSEELSREPKQIELLPHNYSRVVTSPTCTHAGYTTYTCAECGYSYIGDFTDRADHNYKDTVVEPTTESQGYTVHTCTVCGYSYVDSITDILPSEMHYIIPSLEEINATLTIKSNENEYSVTSANGVFELDNIKCDIYRVYASQKNSLTVCIGEYDTKNGEFVNNDVVIPVGNVNGDDVIDLADLSLLLASDNYGKQNSDLDLTGDSQITVEDISLVLQSQNFGAQSSPIV